MDALAGVEAQRHRGSGRAAPVIGCLTGKLQPELATGTSLPVSRVKQNTPLELLQGNLYPPQFAVLVEVRIKLGIEVFQLITIGSDNAILVLEGHWRIAQDFHDVFAAIADLDSSDRPFPVRRRKSNFGSPCCGLGRSRPRNGKTRHPRRAYLRERPRRLPACRTEQTSSTNGRRNC